MSKETILVKLAELQTAIQEQASEICHAIDSVELSLETNDQCLENDIDAAIQIAEQIKYAAKQLICALNEANAASLESEEDEE